MSATRLVPCHEHGESGWCYAWDSHHISTDDCKCFIRPALDCPIPNHRASARAADRRRKRGIQPRQTDIFDLVGQ